MSQAFTFVGESIYYNQTCFAGGDDDIEDDKRFYQKRHIIASTVMPLRFCWLLLLGRMHSCSTVRY